MPELEMHRSLDQLGKFSVTVTVDTERRLPDEEVEELLGKMLERVGRRCLDEGAGLIGHIKAYAQDRGEGMCSANLTSFRVGVESENRLGGEGWQEGDIMLHVIVHGLWDPEVRKLTLDELQGVMGEHGLRYRILRDYFEGGPADDA